MFRTISIIALVVTFSGIGLHSTAGSLKGERERRKVNILKGLVYLVTLLFLEQRLSLLGKLKKLAYLLALLCFLVLAVTGFYPALVLGRRICGYLLMLHVTFGGVFAVCLVFLALTWAYRYRFTAEDWPWLRNVIGRQPRGKFLPEGCEAARKTAFWLIVLGALPLMLSVVLSMSVLFGTAGQHLCADTHRYSALGFALAAVVHTYLTVRGEASR